MSSDVQRNRPPFAGYDHMVQNPPYWNANCALGHSKQRVALFWMSQCAVCVPVWRIFVPCDRILQRAHNGAESIGLQPLQLVIINEFISNIASSVYRPRNTFEMTISVTLYYSCQLLAYKNTSSTYVITFTCP